MKKLVSYDKRPYIYALLISFGIILLFSILHTSKPQTYFFASISLYLLLLFELFSTKYHSETHSDQFKLGERRSHKRANLIHHLLMPSLLYFSFVAFLFVNAQINLLFVAVTLSMVLFSILFLNVKAFYEDKLRLERKTANIYDIVSVIVMFLFNYSLFALVHLSELNDLVAILLVTGLTIVMGYMTLSRYQLLKIANLLIVIAFCLLIIVSGFILKGFGVSILGLSLTSTFYFYYLLVICNHIEDDTLDLEVAIEYLAILVLFYVIVLLGLL